MPKSQAAKELAAKQKAQAKAEKERRKHSDNPKDWGTGKQLVETFKLTPVSYTHLRAHET